MGSLQINKNEFEKEQNVKICNATNISDTEIKYVARNILFFQF